MATPAQLAEAEAWLARFGDAIAELDAGTVAAVQAAYALIDDWERPADTLVAASSAAAASAAGRQAVGELGAQFIATIAAILRGIDIGGSPTSPRLPYSRNAEPFDVYSRPIFAYRDALARGVDEQMAQLEAFRRAQTLALTDNLLARRDASLAQLERQEITRYRRVIRPELSKTGVCGLCIAAASQVYKRSDLMPIHTRCKCEVIPVIGRDDLGERFNSEDLARIYAETPGTRPEELVKTRYRVEDLAELGPVLTPAA